MSGERKYNYLIALVRIISMVCIIICHFTQFYKPTEWFYYYMPFGVGAVMIFTIISGFLYGSKEVKKPIKFIVKNCMKIMIPYYTYMFIIIGMYLIFARQYLDFKNVIGSLLFISEIPGLGHFWYFRVIIICYLITPFLELFCRLIGKIKWKFLKSIILLILPVALLTTVWVLKDLDSQDLIYYTVYILGFNSGFLLMRENINHKATAVFFGILGTLSVASIPVLVSSLIQSGDLARIIYEFDEESFGNNFSLLIQIALLLGAIGLLFVIVAISDVNEKWEYLGFKKAIRLLSDYSFPMFIVHHLYIMGPNPFNVADMNPFLGVHVALILSVISAILLKYVSDKIFNLIFKPGTNKNEQKTVVVVSQEVQA